MAAHTYHRPKSFRASVCPAFPDNPEVKIFMRKILMLALVALLLGVAGSLWAGSGPEPASPAKDGTMPALTAIAGQGMLSTESYDDLQELSDDIGGRVTGSPEAARAVEWGMAKMRAMGLDNVHAEKWQISRGWTRVSASADLISPIHRKLSIDAMGWVGSTQAGGVEADVVPVNANKPDDEIKDNSSKWAGKVLLILRKGPAPTGPAAMAGLYQIYRPSQESVCGACSRRDRRPGRPARHRHAPDAYRRNGL